MDAFEQLVSELLWNEGYWVQTSYKVALSKEQKLSIQRKSSPRWELDIVAYKGGENELLVVECKSFLDSPGVRFRDIEFDSKKRTKGRYKLFSENKLRGFVFENLVNQLSEQGSCSPDATVKFAMAAGKIATENDRLLLKRGLRGTRLAFV